MGVGVDIVEIKRISLDEKFLNLVFSHRELEKINLENKNIKEHIAGLFALKEAFLKALGSGILDIDLRKIEIFHEESHKPYVLYLDKKYDNVSIAHEKEYAVAFALI